MGKKKEDIELSTKTIPTPTGPMKNRSCTDVLCVLLFLVFVAGWVGVGIIGLRAGNPEQLVYPSNSEGEICGRGSHDGKPNLLFHDLTKCLSISATFGCPTPQVCVKNCPGSTTSLYAYAQAKINNLPFPDFDISAQRQYCVPSLKDSEWDEAIKDATKIIELITGRKCPAYVLESIPIAGRCVPDFGLLNGKNNDSSITDKEGEDIKDSDGNGINASTVYEAINKLIEILNLRGVAEKVWADLVNSYWMILAGLGVSVAVAFIWIFLMRFIAGVMVWLSLFLTIALLGMSTAYSWVRYDNLRSDPSAGGSVFGVNPITDKLESYLELRDTWLAFFIISAILLGVILLVTLFLRNRIRLAVALISLSSQAVGNIMSSVFFPFISFLFQLVVIAWFILVSMYLASSSEKQYRQAEIGDAGGECDAGASCDIDQFVNTDTCECIFYKLGPNERENYLQIYNIFGFFWGLCFVSALGEMVLAGAFSSWYWVFDKSDIPTFPVLSSFGRTLRYHTGTLAFGSLIIAIIKMIRLALQYIQDKLEEKGADNPVVKVILCLCKCCFWCLEKFMKFINRNAYILTAIYGSNFCKSAKEAFSLILRNMVRVAVLDKVTDFLLFLGKIVITSTVALLSFLYFSGSLSEKVPLDPAVAEPKLNYYFVPVIIITIGAYFIAACFFSVYTMAVDTLFLCFLVDMEKNDGSKEKPYFMPKKLMSILNLKQKAK